MECINVYANFLKRFLKLQRPLKIILDCSNGTTGPVLKKTFSNYKLLITKYINDNPDGNFPAHGPNPLNKKALKNLSPVVIKNKADAGIIFDADGDRVFFIDNLGRFVDPDVIARFLVWRLKPEKVIIDVNTGWLIKKLKVESLKLKVIESRVGHYFIKKLMRKTKADFASEYSGHYYFEKFFYSDSGILSAIEIINSISELPYKFSEFIDLLPQYYRSGELNFKIKNYSLKKIENKIKKLDRVYKISYLDGLKIEFNPLTEQGWWLSLRPSNTESLLRMNIEAESKKILKEKTKMVEKIIYSNSF